MERQRQRISDLKGQKKSYIKAVFIGIISKVFVNNDEEMQSMRRF